MTRVSVGRRPFPPRSPHPLPPAAMRAPTHLVDEVCLLLFGAQPLRLDIVPERVDLPKGLIVLPIGAPEHPRSVVADPGLDVRPGERLEQEGAVGMAREDEGVELVEEDKFGFGGRERGREERRGSA